MDEIGGVGVRDEERGDLASPVEVTAEQVDDRDAQADAGEGLPERVDRGLPVQAALQGEFVVGRPQSDHRRRPQQDHQHGDAQPAPARLVGEAAQPVPPVGEQPDDEQGDVAREEAQLQVERGEPVRIDRERDAEQRGRHAEAEGEEHHHAVAREG